MQLRSLVGARLHILILFCFLVLRMFLFRFRPRLARVCQLARRPFVALEGMAKARTLTSEITLGRRLLEFLAVRPS